ncbi:MAG: hypothetical protein IJ679_12465 [Lachnospiraceae bacterium]|nr:hypothetical protein [Lachnospiraceae bacterium]
MAEAYLHIGMPKTGTTAIQCFLRDNREELKKQGFCYPDFGYAYPKVGAHRNGYFVSRVDNLYEKEREGSYRKLDKLAKSCEKIILSDEAIWRKQRKLDFWKTIRERFESLGLTLQIIVYLRRQDEMIESFWNHRVKGKGETVSFAEYDEWL